MSNMDKIDADLISFLDTRLESYLIDRGYLKSEIEAVLAVKPKYLCEIPARINAIREFMKLPVANDLIATARRVSKILDKYDQNRH